MASLTIAEDRKSSTLILHHATLRDAAVYYCILGDHSGTDGLQLCNISLVVKRKASNEATAQEGAEV